MEQILLIIIIILLLSIIVIIQWYNIQQTKLLNDKIDILKRKIESNSNDVFSAVDKSLEKHNAYIENRITSTREMKNTPESKELSGIRELITEKFDKLIKYETQEKNFILKQFRLLYWSVDSIIALNSFIKSRKPLQPFRGMAISPDSANIIISLIIENKPNRVLEFGSGTSTLVIGYCLEKNGSGKIISLDHDEKFAGATRRNISYHELDNYAEVLHAPLIDNNINGKNIKWYDISGIDISEKFDLLIVDGPPGFVEGASRYPALPLLMEHLSDNAVIFLDDAVREEEKEIADLWLQEYPELELETVPNEKGSVIFRINR